MPFTFLDWKLAEGLVSGSIKFDQVDDDQVEQLMYNIFPNGDTILHLLHKKGSILEKLLDCSHYDLMDKTIYEY